MHIACTMYIVHVFLHAWWKRKKCGKIWQSLNVYCSPNLIYKHKRNPELLVFWLVAHERKKSTHTCTCLPAQRQITSNLNLLLILFYVGHMYEVIWRKSSESLSLDNFLKWKFFSSENWSMWCGTVYLIFEVFDGKKKRSPSFRMKERRTQTGALLINVWYDLQHYFKGPP